MASLDGILNADEGAVCAGDRTFHEDEVLIGIDAVDFEVLDGDASVTILTSHFAVFHDATRCRRRTDRTTVAFVFVGTV